jgi:hypothetical protein
MIVLNEPAYGIESIFCKAAMARSGSPVCAATSAIRRIVERIEPFPFEQIYGGWWQANVLTDAKAAVARSAERYLRWISA